MLNGLQKLDAMEGVSFLCLCSSQLACISTIISCAHYFSPTQVSGNSDHITELRQVYSCISGSFEVQVAAMHAIVL